MTKLTLLSINGNFVQTQLFSTIAMYAIAGLFAIEFIALVTACLLKKQIHREKYKV